MVLMYPEGVSRYHPSMSPLKTGGMFAAMADATVSDTHDLLGCAVARIVSDVLSRNRDNPDFEVTVATCSITYTCVMHLAHMFQKVPVLSYSADIVNTSGRTS